MKKVGCFLFFAFCVLTQASNSYQSPVEFKIKPIWHMLDVDPKVVEEFGSKLVWAGAIEFKKRINYPITLTRLTLHWSGKKIDNIVASLYKKEIDREFIPIEENLICDSSWDEGSQKLIMKFDKPVLIDAHTTFCLVLTISDELAQLMKEGAFSVDVASLPPSLRQSIDSSNLRLAYHSFSACPIRVSSRF